MNWDKVEGKWKQRRGTAMKNWGKLMNDELAIIAGKHEQFVGALQEKYGIAKEEARKHVDEFKKVVEQLKKSNAELIKLQKSSGKKRIKSSRKAVNGKASAKRKSQSKIKPKK